MAGRSPPQSTICRASPANGRSFVSLLGGLTRRFAASPFDVIHRLAERTGAEAYVMPVPFFANTGRTRTCCSRSTAYPTSSIWPAQPSLNIAGIGEVNAKTFLAAGGMTEASDLAEMKSAGAVGELLGHFFDAEGRARQLGFGPGARAPISRR